MSDHERLAGLADPSLEQHFLVSPTKLTLLMDAAGIRPTDQVVELGAGAGTVARSLPPSASLTVIELDERLAEHLKRNMPKARVIHGDGVELIRQIPCDVLISNLPNYVTESLLDILPQLSFRTAVVTVGESSQVERMEPYLGWSEVTTISGDDFVPPQSTTSRVVRIFHPSVRA